MVSIIDVAAYILARYGSLSTMKLQKLVYYSQAHCLATTGTPLFCEDFQAWRGGPVSPALFDKHRGLFLIESRQLQTNLNALNRHQRQIIDTVCDCLGDCSGNQLSKRTHSEDPWRIARHGLQLSEHGNDVISKDSIRDYYSSHPLLAQR